MEKEEDKRDGERLSGRGEEGRKGTSEIDEEKGGRHGEREKNIVREEGGGRE